MPTDPRLWLRNPIASSHPACQAVKAATEQGSEAGYAYLRRVREGLMVERRKLDHAEALVGEAGPAGLDVDRFRIDLDSNATIEAFAADLDEVRGGGSSFLGLLRERGRLAARRRAGRPYADAYRGRAGGGGGAATDRLPETLEVVERFGRAATREVEALTGRPRPSWRRSCGRWRASGGCGPWRC